MKRSVIVASFVLPIFLIALWEVTPNATFANEKIAGASLVSPRDSEYPYDFNGLSAIQAGYVAIIPYAFSRSGEDTLIFNHQRQWWGERTDGVEQMIKEANELKYKVMLKPHIWIGGEGWPGDFRLSQKGWENWEKDYRSYVLQYATLAEKYEVEILCIGTEVRWSVKERPEFWKSLIKEVRRIYSGKITYAANWDNYQVVEFWNQLDYIGIDAYFPIDQSENPTMENLRLGWEPIRKELEKFSDKYSKPILFTEYGYQSIVGTAREPWNRSRENVCMDCQSNAYQALFDIIWEEEWFSGGFLWKWHLKSGRGGALDSSFTPQGKDAISVIRQQYSDSN